MKPISFLYIISHFDIIILFVLFVITFISGKQYNAPEIIFSWFISKTNTMHLSLAYPVYVYHITLCYKMDMYILMIYTITPGWRRIAHIRSSWCVLYANSFSVLMENIKGIERNCFREKSFPFSRNFIAYHFVIKKGEEKKKEIYTSRLNKANSYSSIYNLVYDFLSV